MPLSTTTVPAQTPTPGTSPSLRTERRANAAPGHQPPRSRPIGRRGYPLFVLALLVTMLGVITLSVSVGALSLPVGTVWGSVADHLLGRPIDPTNVHDRVIWTLRLPRVLLAVVVGAALSVAGTTLQACVRAASQQADCRKLAEQLGWAVAEVFTDNDISAYSGKPRPAYAAMLEAIRSGAVDAVSPRRARIPAAATTPDRRY